MLDAISDICISMKAEDYLELPDFIQHEVPVLLDAKARRAYDQFERDLLLEVDEDVITAASAAVLVGNSCKCATVLCIAMMVTSCRSMTASWRPIWSCWSS